MLALLVAYHELSGGYDKLPGVLYVFEPLTYIF